MFLNITIDATTFLGDTKKIIAPTVVIQAVKVFIKLVRKTGFKRGNIIFVIVLIFDAPKSLEASSILVSMVVKAALVALFATDICLNVEFRITIAVVPVRSNGSLLNPTIYPSPKKIPGIIYGRAETNSI